MVVGEAYPTFAGLSKVDFMSKPSDRKQKKKNDRQRRLVAKTRADKYLQEYPQFRFLEPDESTTPELVELVKKTVRTIRFDDPATFSTAESKWFRQICKVAIDPRLKDGNFGLDYGHIKKLGDIVLSRDSGIEEYLPFNLLQFVPDPRTGSIVVAFKSLKTEQSDHGRIYFSANRPTVSVDGVDLVVGWRRHAIDRLRTRLLYKHRDIEQASEAFWYLHRLAHFELCELSDAEGKRQPAFSFFNNCVEGFASGKIASSVLGEFPQSGRWFYRLGYCSYDIEGKFIVARMVLFPGYSKTPEYSAIARSTLTRDEKERLRKIARELSFESLFDGDNMEVLRWFHEHGAPQVIRGNDSWLGAM